MASHGVSWRLVTSRGVSSRRLVASLGVLGRLGAKGTVLKRAEGVCPACKGESTMETPPHVSYCLRCVRSYAVCRVPCVIVCCALCVVCFVAGADQPKGRKVITKMNEKLHQNFKD